MIEERFVKVVKYYYPDGSVFESGAIGFYFISFIVWFLYSIFCLFTFPFRFFWSDLKGEKKVYWKKIRSKKVRVGK